MTEMKHDWIKGSGKIIYDPARPGLKKRPEKWCIITVDRELTRYFRWWVDKMYLNPLGLDKNGLCQPSWDAHISVIRGLNDLRHARSDWKDFWKKYHGETVDFEYSLTVRQAGDTTGWDRPNAYWFVNVRCPKAMEIREELELRTNWSLHLTIGRTWE